MPVIATADVLATVQYYVDVLGFEEHFIYGDPPVYAGLERNDVLLYVTKDDRLATALVDANLHPEVFLWVSQIDSVYAEHQRRGARFIEEISDRPWDARQYVVMDPNGYHLKIAQPLMSS